MTKILAVQMEDMAIVDYKKSTSFSMMLEAQNRGYDVYHYEPHHMVYEDGEVYAYARPLSVQFTDGNSYTWTGDRTKINLKQTDVILLRSEPPFDMSYITATYYLDMVQNHTRVINNPTSVRSFSEKLIMGYFPQYSAPTIVSTQFKDFEAFINIHKTIILKPLYGYGGSGITKVNIDDDNLKSLLEIYTNLYKQPIMAQKFLPEIADGDKRIFLANGEPIFTYNRVLRKGDNRANLHAGGRVDKVELTPREKNICATLKPFLQTHGLDLAGIDIIGDYLIEVNVTSPGGLGTYRTAFDVDYTGVVFDAIGI